MGAALLGKKLGYDVFLSDRGRLADRYRRILEAHDVAFEEGQHTEKRILEADLAVKSPGIPETAPWVVRLREKGIEVVSEIEFAGRHTDARMVCITGSNGKTTTTLLVHHILTRAGVDAGLAGNVGKSLAAQVAEQAHGLYVVELSSFQLDGMFRFRADIGVLTNVTPDHLDRYQYRFENYVDSKFRILNNMRPEELFIYGWDSEAVRQKLETLQVVPEMAGFTYAEGKGKAGGGCGAWMEGDFIVASLDGRVFRMDKNELAVKGRHNVYNAMAAILVCLRLGLADEQIGGGLRTFPQVEHRLETVATVHGVVYVNDSKATNVDSSWYALESMTAPVVWIAGGTDKGNDYSVLEELVRRKVRVLVCMGADNRKLAASFRSVCPVVDTHTLEDAMAAARKYAQPGDTVLLSPCCASFDLFENYENRGELFKAAVRRLGQADA